MDQAVNRIAQRGAILASVVLWCACSDGGPKGDAMQGMSGGVGGGAASAAVTGGMNGNAAGTSAGMAGASGSPIGGAGASGNGSLDGGGGGAGASDGGTSDGAVSDDAGDALPITLDPGTAEWQPVPESEVAETCKLDPALLAQADMQLNVPYAIIRYGKLCHEFNPPGQTPMSAAEVYSSTKSLGALMVGMVSYQTRDIPRSGPKTGQLSDWDRVDHWLDTFTYNPEAHVAHVLGMVAHNPNFAHGQKQHAYDTVGDVQINSLSDMVNTAIAQDPTRLGANIEEFTQRYLYEPLGMTLSSWTTDLPDKVFAYTWSSSVREMARVGLLILNRGVWNGERLVDAEWIYKMTHPAFEDGNTSYGYLTWLASWSNHSIGFSPPTSQGPNIVGHGGNPCAPVALWNHYPHGELSEAPDCNYESPYTCDQENDVGVWQAVGLGGQVIQGHPGLDMVLVVRNEAGGGAGLWTAIIPAVAELDPMYAGDIPAFCAAYSSNEYAPDLAAPWLAYD